MSGEMKTKKIPKIVNYNKVLFNHMNALSEFDRKSVRRCNFGVVLFLRITVTAMTLLHLLLPFPFHMTKKRRICQKKKIQYIFMAVVNKKKGKL